MKLVAKIENVDSRRNIELLLNNRPVRDFRFKNERLEITLQLKEGSNEIELIAENTFGLERKRLTIDYIIPKPPNVAILSPTANSISKEKTVPLKVRIQNVSERKEIKLFVIQTPTQQDLLYLTFCLSIHENNLFCLD